MKNKFWVWGFFTLLLVLAILVGGYLKANVCALRGPGNLFIRQQASNYQNYRTAFLSQRAGFKAHGFSAYSFHLDLKNPHIIITTLKCSDLQKGLAFVRGPELEAALGKAGARIPEVWYGLDTTPRHYDGLPKKPAGIVIARNEVKDYPFWLKCFYAEDGGKHNHPGRHYKNSAYSIHHLPGNPAIAIVVHEASNVSKAPPFMVSDPMVGEMESTGVVGLQLWYGVNMDEGTF
ncbi:MAG: hypothetical protein ACREL1_00825 [bacterium]